MQKILKTFLASMMVIVLSVAPSITANANAISVAGYQDWDFTWRSAVDPLVLNMDVDSVSLMATCEDEDDTDVLTCYVIDLTYNGAYTSSFPFVADGTVTTIPTSLPEGRYKIYIVGSSTIVKDYAVVVFSHFTN